MTDRVFADWLPAFLKYADVVESPRLMHFWAGVAAISGALRRKVWIDMKRFQWTPNFYIIFVAPPGLVAKSTTADIGMELLKKVPGIKFGPDVITWPALVTAFSEATESFEYNGEYHPMSPLILVASELGNLINPQDRDMINLYINLWDNRKSLEKRTKTSGNDSVEAPWVTMMGCTTPHWIADNMPSATVGGGFTSRCVFVYADKKEKYVAYVDEQVSNTDDKHKEALIQDLEHISTHLAGPYHIEEAARVWGRHWYQKLWDTRPEGLDDDRLDGYVARKQTHMHKLAMVLAASQRDELVITAEDLAAADAMLIDTEKGLSKVFSRIGRTEESLQVERFMNYLKRRVKCTYEEAFQSIHAHFPDFRDYEGVLNGLIRSGQVGMIQEGSKIMLVYRGQLE
jgi:hypothetical protein